METTAIEPAVIRRWEDAPDFLKPQEAAKLLRVGKNKIYEWAAIEGFPKMQTGTRNFVIPKDELKEWLKTRVNMNAERLVSNI